MWELFGGLFFFGVGIYLFTSVFHPEWDIRWGRGRYKFRERAPASIAGKIGMGIFFFCFGLLFLLGNPKSPTSYILSGIMFVDFLGTFVIAMRDSYRYKKSRDVQ